MLESNQDGIKRLAEAMGWTETKYQRWLSPDRKMRCDFPPDPFTDASDDYAVLEWIRSQGVIGSWIATQLGKDNKWSIDYKIGDYARAALKVIERV